MTIPETVSPLRSTAPCRGAGPIATVATSRSRTGVPLRDSRTMSPKSAVLSARPAPRMVYCSSLCSMKPPPKFWLFSSTRSATSLRRHGRIEQGIRIDGDLILLDLAPPGVHFAHPRHHPELPLDLPLLQVLQRHGAHGTAECVLVKFVELSPAVSSTGWIPLGS